MKNTKIILITAILLIAFAGGGFYAVTKYQQSQRGSPRGEAGQIFRQFNGQGGQNNQARRIGFRPVTGEIINRDDKSITVKLQDGGGSKIVLFSDSTSINKASEGSKDDLKEGAQVAVFGADNSDGSVTTQSIQLHPQNRGMFNQPIIL